jgi:hypothetical protein
VTDRNRRSRLRSRAGHDLLGGLTAVAELAGTAIRGGARIMRQPTPLTGRLAVASPSPLTDSWGLS